MSEIKGVYVLSVNTYCYISEQEHHSVVGVFKNKQNAINHLYEIGFFPVNANLTKFEMDNPEYTERVQQYNYFHHGLHSYAKITYKEFYDNKV